MRGGDPRTEDGETDYAGTVCFAPAGWFEGAGASERGVLEAAAAGPSRPGQPSEPRNTTKASKALLLGPPDDVRRIQGALGTRYAAADTVSLVPGALEAGLRLTPANVAGWTQWLLEEDADRLFVYAGAGSSVDVQALVAALPLTSSLTLVSEVPVQCGGYTADGATPRASDNDGAADWLVLSPALAAQTTMSQALCTVLARGDVCYRTLLREIAAAGAQIASGRSLDLDARFIP